MNKTEEMQQEVLQALCDGKIPVTNLIIGDQVQNKTINNYYGQSSNSEEPLDDSVPQSIKPTDIPDDCSKAATDVFTKEMRLNNGVCANSIAQCKKAIAQLILTRPVHLAYLLAICKETKCVKPDTGATDFVRSLIGIGSICYTGQEEIKRLSDGIAHKELKPLHTQWDTKDRPIGDLLYQEILKSD